MARFIIIYKYRNMTPHKKPSFILIITVVLSCSMNAQKTMDGPQTTLNSEQDIMDSNYRNAIKINMAAFVFENLSLQYERSINPHWSLQLGAGFKWGGDIPKVLGLGNFVVTSDTRGIQGYSVTPEARYYFNNCKCPGPLTGLYAGTYTRMTRFFSDLRFHYWNGSEYHDVGGAGDFRELGIGVQLGYKFILKKRFTVDLMFMGPRISRNRLRFELDSNFAEEVIPLIEDEINKRLEYLGIDPISIPTSASVDANFGFSYFRYAISIGFVF